MNAAVLAVVLAVALMGIAVALNHCHARLALVELTLNEGLPPGHQIQVNAATPINADVGQLLGQGVHVFLSRNCHACQRLLDELQHSSIDGGADVHLRYVDRPRPVASEAADRVGAILHSHQAELATQAGADPLPYTVAVGAHGLVAGSVTPTVAHIVTATRDAGITIATQGPTHESTP